MFPNLLSIGKGLLDSATGMGKKVAEKGLSAAKSTGRGLKKVAEKAGEGLKKTAEVVKDKVSEGVSAANEKANEVTDSVNNKLTSFRDSKPPSKESSESTKEEPKEELVELSEGDHLINKHRNDPKNSESIKRGSDSMAKGHSIEPTIAEVPEEDYITPDSSMVDENGDLIREVKKTNKLLGNLDKDVTGKLDDVSQELDGLGNKITPLVPEEKPPEVVPEPEKPKPDPEIKKTNNLLQDLREAIVDKVAGGLDKVRMGIAVLDEKLGTDTGETQDDIKERDDERKARGEEREQRRDAFLENIKNKAKAGASAFGEYAGLLPVLLFVASFLAKQLVKALKGVGNYVGKSIDKTKETLAYNLQKGKLALKKGVSFTDASKAEVAQEEADLEKNHSSREKEIETDSTLASASNSGTKDEKAKAATDYFESKGYTSEQAAGIVNNLLAESNLNPRQKQNNGGPARGIAQWEGVKKDGTEYGRFVGLKNFAKQQGTSWEDFGTQLKYLNHELDTDPSNGKRYLLRAKTTKEATEAFLNNFERSKIANNRNKGGSTEYASESKRRVGLGEKYYAENLAGKEQDAVNQKDAGVMGFLSNEGQTVKTSVAVGKVSTDPVKTKGSVEHVVPIAMKAEAVKTNKIPKSPKPVKPPIAASKKSSTVVAGNNSNNSQSTTVINNTLSDNSLNAYGS